MSSDPKLLLDAVLPGRGYALDLGGGSGRLRKALEHKGYRYVNADLRRREGDNALVIGNAQNLPFQDGVFAVIVSNDSLEHFLAPHEVVCEVARVLGKGGEFVIHVPFLQPFHANDTYRYTPVGLRYLLSDLAGLEIVRLESPLWIFSILGFIVIGVCRKAGLSLFEGQIEGVCRAIDCWLTNLLDGPRSLAASYLVVARKS